MAIFQPPPPSAQGRSNSTLPIPHAPIPAQGDPPPRRQVAVAVMMATVLAAWPADLEPRLQRPNDQRTKIAPLTLTYGQQPPVNGPITPTEYRLIVGTWPGALDAPLVPRVPIATATLPPPPIASYVPPHPTGWVYPAIVLATQEPLEVVLVPTGVLAPDNPDPPPIQGPLTATELRLIVGTWPTDYPPILRTRINAATLPAPPVVTYVPPARFPDAIARAWQPPDPLPLQRVESVVPTFAAVDPPPVVGRSSLAIIVSAWAQTWGAQSAAKNAAWNQPQPQTAPPTRFPAHLLAASQPPDPLPVQRVRSVVPTFPTVSPPPRRPPLLVAQRVAIANWPADLEPRLSLPNASRIPFVPLPRPPFHAFWLLHLNEQIGPTPQQPSPL